ncbi:MAG: hypothetical protein FJ291_29075 [Planctomycetes bacterium]|nr:hypothetical protein [Planctomycetota bacterium]
MNWRGQYTTDEALSKWPREGPLEAGDLPAVHAEFRFGLLDGSVEAVPMWAHVDTGAEGILVPGIIVGIREIAAGKPVYIDGSIAARSTPVSYECRGIGGSSVGVLLRARISLDGQELPGVFYVGTCNDIEYPVIGLPVLKQFTGLLNGPDRELCFSNSRLARKLARLCTRLGV